MSMENRKVEIFYFRAISTTTMATVYVLLNFIFISFFLLLFSFVCGFFSFFCVLTLFKDTDLMNQSKLKKKTWFLFFFSI